MTRSSTQKLNRHSWLSTCSKILEVPLIFYSFDSTFRRTLVDFVYSNTWCPRYCLSEVIFSKRFYAVCFGRIVKGIRSNVSNVVHTDEVEYKDPVDGSISKHRGIGYLFEDGSRFGKFYFRFSRIRIRVCRGRDLAIKMSNFYNLLWPVWVSLNAVSV